MQPWIDELLRLAPVVLSTDTPLIMAVMMATGTLLFLLVFCKLGQYLEFHQCDVPRGLIVLVVTLGAMFAATIAAGFYLEPRFGVWPARLAPAVGFMAAGLILCWVTRAKYFRGLLALALSLAAAAGIMVMTRTVLYAFAAGDRSADRVRDRREDTRELFGD